MSIWIKTALAGIACVTASPAMARCNRGTAVYDLPAQRLDETMQQISRISGCPIKVDLSLVADRQAPALKGRYTPEAALASVARHSGFAASSTKEGLAYDGSFLSITMTQARILRTVIENRERAGKLRPAVAANLRTRLRQIERSLPRLVDRQGMVTAAQKADAIAQLDAVRAPLGPVLDAVSWPAFKRSGA